MKRILTFANLRLAVEIVLILAALFIVSGRITPTAAAPMPIEQASSSSAAALLASNWYECVTPTQVAVFTNRVHVRCTSTNPTTGIAWFAFPTSPDSAAASRILSLFQTAYLTNERLLLWLDPSDTSGSSFGCGSGDCRRITGAELYR